MNNFVYRPVEEKMNILQQAHAHISNSSNYTGIWFVFHNLARRIITENDKDCLMKVVYKTVDDFRCSACRGHAIEYLNSHSVDDYWTRVNDYGEDVGLFEYFWEFHNAVNLRIGKPVLNWDDAYQLYYKDVSMCNDCSKKPSSRFRLSG